MSDPSDSSKNERRRNSLAENPILSIWIDSYDDIFSDFDPRPFAERTISDDFLLHARKIAREYKGMIPSLNILVPEKLRNDESERAIRKRVESHLSAVFERLREEGMSIRRKGIYFVLIGTTCMLVSSYLNFQAASGFSIYLMRGLLEPGGWFLFWTGLDALVNFSKSNRREIEFYKKMSSAHVKFDAY